MTAANGESSQVASISQKLHLITPFGVFDNVGCKEGTRSLLKEGETYLMMWWDLFLATNVVGLVLISQKGLLFEVTNVEVASISRGIFWLY